MCELKAHIYLRADQCFSMLDHVVGPGQPLTYETVRFDSADGCYQQDEMAGPDVSSCNRGTHPIDIRKPLKSV